MGAMQQKATVWITDENIATDVIMAQCEEIACSNLEYEIGLVQKRFVSTNQSLQKSCSVNVR